MTETPIPEPFVLQADAPPPPAPTPETDAVWADKNQNILEHAKCLERQRDALNQATLQTFSAYMGANEVARVTLGLIEASLQRGLHHSRPALEAALPELRKQLGNISKGLTPP